MFLQGDGQQGRIAFVRFFKFWATFQNLDTSIAMSALVWLLRDKASLWLLSLVSDQISNFPQILTFYKMFHKTDTHC